MTDSIPPSHQVQDRGRLVIILALIAGAILLLAILFMLISISRNGINFRLSGDINLSDLSDRITVELTMDKPIALAMSQPLQLVATGPDGEPIPATLSFATCPSCGGSMLLSKWNPWDGRIEWICPTCGETGPPLDTP